MRSRYWFAGILAVLALGLAACGGGNGDDEVPEPTATAATTATEQPTVEAPTVPQGTPTITGNLLEFEAKGYSVRFPEGWTPQPNFLPAPDISVDAFFAPEEIGGIQPNIAVTCEALQENVTLQEYFDAKLDIVRQVTQLEPEVSSREVSGQEALVSSYTREESDTPLQKTEVVFLTEKCGFGIALTVPAGQGGDYQQQFDEFLGSFNVLP